MKCQIPGCSGDLRVTNTYSVNEFAKTQAIVCLKCGARMTGVVLLRLADKYGTGAAAEASRLKRQYSKKED